MQKRKRVSIEFTQPSLTEPKFQRSNADLYQMWLQNGAQARRPIYADVSHFTSYREALQFVEEAREEFEKLPPKIRAMCNHDPVQLGLLDPKEIRKILDDHNSKAIPDPQGAERPELEEPELSAPAKPTQKNLKKSTANAVNQNPSEEG